MKYAWLYIKYKARRIMRNIEMVYRILHFCWKYIIVIILTKFKHSKSKRRMIRKRWESMHNYKVTLETEQIFRKDSHGQTVGHVRVRSSTLAYRIVGIKTNPGLMPGTAFSRN